LVILVILFYAISASFGQGGTIKGLVLDQKTNEPIPFVNIVIDGKPTEGTTSDIDGKYTLKGIEPGYVRLIASCVGYRKYISTDILVTKAYPVSFDIRMDQEVVDLQAVEVRPLAVTRNEMTPISLQTLTIQEIEKSPGSNRDISKVIQSLPGVALTLAYRNDVIVRGGGPNENRFYLDGVEIPNINHFATQGASGGPVGIINVDLIRDLKLYSGAFPADRGNALSSVLELQQIDGNKDKFGGRLTLGASDFGLTLNGPITKKSTLIFSVRRSYLQFLFSLLKLPFLPTYNDYQLKYRIDFNQRNQLSVISIGALDNSKLNTGIKNPDEYQKYILGYLPAYKQWSYTFGLVYRHFRKTGYDTYVFSRSMLDNEEIKYQDNVEVPDSLTLNYKSTEAQNKIRYEGVSDIGNWKLSYGAGVEYDEYTNKTYQKIFLADSLRTLDYSSNLDFFAWNLFGQFNKTFFRNRLSITFGFRMDANNYSGMMDNLLNQFSPRLSASYGLVRDKLFLNFNTGRYLELPAYTTLGFRDNAGDLVNKDLGIRYISADHVVLGLEYHPKQNAKITLEGFYKYYEHYPFSIRDSVSLASKGTDFGVIGDEPVLPDSRGRAYGLEVYYRDADLFRFNIMLSYTYVRSEFTNYFGEYIPSSWDNRNLFNITVGRKFKYHWEVGLKWRYAGGAPYTPWDLNRSSIVVAWDAQGQGYLDYSQYNSLRLKSFNQLDIRVDKEFFFKKWSLMVYVDVQNVLNEQAQQPDILVNTQPDGSVVKYVDDQGVERYKLRQIPNSTGTILPAVGIMVDF
jgi:hypothetical protein